jgi:hypothetical protein
VNQQNRCAAEVRYTYRIVSNDTTIRDEPIGDRVAVALRKVFNCHVAVALRKVFNALRKVYNDT